MFQEHRSLRRLIVIPALLLSCSSNDESLDEASSDEASSEAAEPNVASQSSALSDGDFISYAVKPAFTDGPARCDEHDPNAIGCNLTWDDAPNEKHVLYVNPEHRNSGKLLVYFNGQNGTPGWPDTPGSAGSCTSETCELYRVAANQGYHVIALSYYSRSTDAVQNVGRCGQNLPCFGKFMNEVLDGNPDCPDSICGDKLRISEHPQDSITHRLTHLLWWADFEHPNDGWGRYLTADGKVKWSMVAPAGFSLGSGYAALLALKHPEVSRVVLFASPNDGKGTNADDWIVAPWIENAGDAASKYFGLIHIKNKMTSEDSPNKLYRTYQAWVQLGMEGLWLFDPEPGLTTNFHNAQMLVSVDPETAAEEAHVSVVRDRYGTVAGAHPCTPSAANHRCRIGYKDAWRYVLGNGLGTN